MIIISLSRDFITSKNQQRFWLSLGRIPWKLISNSHSHDSWATKFTTDKNKRKNELVSKKSAHDQILFRKSSLSLENIGFRAQSRHFVFSTRAFISTLPYLFAIARLRYLARFALKSGPELFWKRLIYGFTGLFWTYSELDFE